jgi:dTDP-4-amino-4,6-dideoxygalactose transaminase
MNTSEPIPFLDLIAPHAELRPELDAVFQQALNTAGFIGGTMVDGFETAFAAFCDAQHCVGVCSGTDALLFALLACGVKPGDSVITVPHTFIATTEAIAHAGAFAEFVDIDERTYNMDPECLRDYLEGQCRRDPAGGLVSARSGRPVTAVIPVHLYGQSADMDPIVELAERYGLQVIEDACQAHGAEYFSRREQAWRTTGSLGRAAAFSFYPGKNLGACGEAGAVTTNDPAVAQRIRALRDHGQARKYYHDIEGYNGRLDAIQAGFLHVKLAHLQRWNAERRERAAEYRRLFDGADGVAAPHEPSWSRAVHHLYVVRVADRDALIAHLKEAGIGTGIHYPIPLHLQRAYADRGYKAGDYPVAERAAAEIVSLPMFPNLTAVQQRRVVDEIKSFVSAGV